MRQNLLLSGGILLALIPLAAAGLLGLAAVVAIHELAEVIVIANGVRAGRRGGFRAHPPLEQPPAPSARPAVPLAVALGGGGGCRDGLLPAGRPVGPRRDTMARRLRGRERAQAGGGSDRLAQQPVSAGRT